MITPLGPEGQVKVNGEIWQARSDHGTPVGETVMINAVHGLTLEVGPAERPPVAPFPAHAQG